MFASGPSLHIKKINKADQHVVAAASQYSAWILTGDIKLAAECQNQNIAARLPLDAIIEASIRKKQNPPLNHIFRVSGISASKGTFFARLVTGGWGGIKSAGRFTACDVENIGRIYYDSFTEEWVFSTTLGTEARLKCPVQQNQPWIVSATYELENQKSKGNVTLRAAQPQGNSLQQNISLKGKITAQTPGEITFGHSCKRSDYWNGSIRKIVLSPITIDAKAWRAVVKVPEAAPDPASGDVLEAAMLRVQIEASRLVVPSERWFRNSWM
jgi:hypothetical protein